MNATDPANTVGVARHRVERVALALITVFMAPAGLQAAFTPRSFFDDFPLGRGWIAHHGDSYNEHLVRDVGALLLGLIIVTAWTVLRRRPGRAGAVAWLVQGGLHVVYHVGHLDGYRTGGQDRTDRLARHGPRARPAGRVGRPAGRANTHMTWTRDRTWAVVAMPAIAATLTSGLTAHHGSVCGER